MMNGFLAVIPIILIRYGLLGIINKAALKRADLFPTMIGGERIAFWVYQITNTLMFIYLFFLKINIDNKWFIAGMAVYLLGTVLYALAAADFARPKGNGINLGGLYKMSRNPMYTAYFIYFLGCALLTSSMILLGLLIVFQFSVHWIILSEERWCIQEFEEEYRRYMSRVKRYI